LRVARPLRQRGDVRGLPCTVRFRVFVTNSFAWSRVPSGDVSRARTVQNPTTPGVRLRCRGNQYESFVIDACHRFTSSDCLLRTFFESSIIETFFRKMLDPSCGYDIRRYGGPSWSSRSTCRVSSSSGALSCFPCRVGLPCRPLLCASCSMPVAHLLSWGSNRLQILLSRWCRVPIAQDFDRCWKDVSNACQDNFAKHVFCHVGSHVHQLLLEATHLGQMLLHGCVDVVCGGMHVDNVRDIGVGLRFITLNQQLPDVRRCLQVASNGWPTS
jgi:hypothetical protein